MKISILGAGLAGSEAALQLSKNNFEVTLIEAKPNKNILPEVYTQKEIAELVCSNSLKSESPVTGSFLLKEEMRIMDSFLLKIAQKNAVPAGASLAVNREDFSKNIETIILNTQNINFIKNEKINTLKELKEKYPADFFIIATGPLTDETMMDSISKEHSFFFDAIAPLVSRESLDETKLFMASRYNKGDADFLNVPLSKEEYENFVKALLEAEKLPYNTLENPKFFERCMPIEELARRGEKTLAFGPMRPVGFLIDGKRPFAVLQLRTENKEMSIFNLVGCQTRMKHHAQKQVFSTLPGFQNAEFLRYGSVHRNSFVNAPKLLDNFFLKTDSTVAIIGQLSGVEGYNESIWSGIFVALQLLQKSKNKIFSLPPITTMSGGILNKLTQKDKNFQPVNANFSLIYNPNNLKKRDRKAFYVTQGIKDFKQWFNSIQD